MPFLSIKFQFPSSQSESLEFFRREPNGGGLVPFLVVVSPGELEDALHAVGQEAFGSSRALMFPPSVPEMESKDRKVVVVLVRDQCGIPIEGSLDVERGQTREDHEFLDRGSLLIGADGPICNMSSADRQLARENGKV